MGRPIAKACDGFRRSQSAGKKLTKNGAMGKRRPARNAFETSRWIANQVLVDGIEAWIPIKWRPGLEEWWGRFWLPAR